MNFGILITIITSTLSRLDCEVMMSDVGVGVKLRKSLTNHGSLVTFSSARRTIGPSQSLPICREQLKLTYNSFLL